MFLLQLTLTSESDFYQNTNNDFSRTNLILVEVCHTEVAMGPDSGLVPQSRLWLGVSLVRVTAC